METLVRKLDRLKPDKFIIKEAASLILQGELVAFPTETVYGLGGNALDEAAAKRIYLAKGRPSDNPLIVHIAKMSALEEVAEHIPEAAYRLAEVFWPGPLTLILKKKKLIPDSITGGLDTVAVRMPVDEIARLLIEEAGVPIAAPSANLSGRPSTTKAEHVIQDLFGRISMILDGGAATLGLESTILDLSGEEPLILRPGFISKEDLESVVESVSYDKPTSPLVPKAPTSPRAPGMKYRHYAPKAELVIYEGTQEEVANAINTAVAEREASHQKVGILVSDETASFYKKGIIRSLGSRERSEQIAFRLFAELRAFDDEEVDIIFAENFEMVEYGHAIMNRLLKAASYRVVRLGVPELGGKE